MGREDSKRERVGETESKADLELTKEGKIIRVYTELVNLVLESVIVQQNGSLDYTFMGMKE